LRQGCEAINRGDRDVLFALYHPEVETIYPPELASLGFEPTHGRLERIRAQERWKDQWGEFRVDPEEAIDLGDRLILLVRLRGSGLASGVPFDNECAYIFTLSAGRVVHERMLFNHSEALETVGLSQ
jgi:ketosteroid isomerase-like protein